MQCVLRLNPVRGFQAKIKTWEAKPACRAGWPLGKRQESWDFRGGFAAAACAGNAEWETRALPHHSPAQRVLLPVRRSGGRSPSAVVQILPLQPAFLQLLGERCGDPGWLGCLGAGSPLLAAWQNLLTREPGEQLRSPQLSPVCCHWRTQWVPGLSEDTVPFPLSRHRHVFQPAFSYPVRFITLCLEFCSYTLVILRWLRLEGNGMLFPV